MTHLRWALAFSLLLLSAVLAFFLQEFIYQNLILPLAYLWWTIVNAYHLIPQLFLWILLLAVVFMLIIGNFVVEIPRARRRENKLQPMRGQVEVMASWLTRADQGNYFKWLIANRLARIARELEEGLDWRARPKSRGSRLPDHVKDSSPNALENYLDAGLNKSFGDFPNPRNWFQRRESTPLDLDPAQVVDYLESQMEENFGRRP